MRTFGHTRRPPISKSSTNGQMSMKLFCLCQTVWFDCYYKIFIQYSVLYRFKYCFSHFLKKKYAFSYNECVFIRIFAVFYSVVESVEFVINLLNATFYLLHALPSNVGR